MMIGRLVQHAYSQNTRPRQAFARSGFSLFELVLVLVILVVLGAVLVPNMSQLMRGRQLQREAESIRIAWEQTRIKAMRSGQAQMFRYVIGTNQYSIEPWLQSTDMTEAGPGATVMGAAGLVSTSETGMMNAVPADVLQSESSKKLGEGIIFSAGNTVGDSRSLMAATESGSTGAAGGTNSLGPPIMFYPDGTTSTAELVVADDQGAQWILRMRGLTGEVMAQRARSSVTASQ